MPHGRVTSVKSFAWHCGYLHENKTPLQVSLPSWYFCISENSCKKYEEKNLWCSVFLTKLEVVDLQLHEKRLEHRNFHVSFSNYYVTLFATRPVNSIFHFSNKRIKTSAFLKSWQNFPKCFFEEHSLAISSLCVTFLFQVDKEKSVRV